MSDCINEARYTARKLWIKTYGLIPSETQVCHTCDNPYCRNLEHLFLGTQSDNTKDCVAKNRHVCNFVGSRGNSKLTHDDVIMIRSSDKSDYELSNELNVSSLTIWKVKTFRCFKDVK